MKIEPTNASVEIQPAQPTTDVAVQPATVSAPITTKDNVFDPEKGDELMAGLDTSTLKSAQVGSLNISTQYYDFQLGKPVRAVFLGMTMAKTVNQQTFEEVELPSAVFVDETNTVYINSAIKLVTALAQLSAKTPVEMTWNGTKKTSSGGQMRTFDVRLLKPVGA